MKIKLECVDNLRVGHIYRPPRSYDERDFNGLPWRKVTELEDLTDGRTTRIHSAIWPEGEALGRYDVVQVQDHSE